MNQELREKALTKMLVEMNGKHSGAIDKIHNFLCDQEDDALFEGIMKEDRSIIGSIKYAANKARATSQDNCVIASEESSLERHGAALAIIDELIEGYEAIIETYDKALKIRYFGGKR